MGSPEEYVPAPVVQESQESIDARERKAREKTGVRTEVDGQLKTLFVQALGNRVYGDALAALDMRLRLNGIRI